jgi:hypothetical protein
MEGHPSRRPMGELLLQNRWNAICSAQKPSLGWREQLSNQTPVHVSRGAPGRMPLHARSAVRAVSPSERPTMDLRRQIQLNACFRLHPPRPSRHLRPTPLPSLRALCVLRVLNFSPPPLGPHTMGRSSHCFSSPSPSSCLRPRTPPSPSAFTAKSCPSSVPIASRATSLARPRATSISPPTPRCSKAASSARRSFPASPRPAR